MMRSIVINQRNAPPGQAVSARFGVDGGTIGRAANNALVLDDPERTVSRVHAQVVCRDGRYFIIDRGSNPTLYNGQMLGAGNETPLNDGDRLMIGGFDLAVQVLEEEDAAPASAAGGSAQPVPAIAGAPSADEDPFANLMDGLDVPPVAPPASAAPTLPVREPEGMPDPSVDLLAPPPASPLAAQPAGGAPADLSDLAVPIGEGAPNIDSLFRTGGGSRSSNWSSDPLAGTPLAEPLHQPNTAANADPLAALSGGVAQPPPAPHSDHLPIGQFSFVPPQALTPGAASAPVTVPASAPAAASSAAPAASDMPAALRAAPATPAPAPPVSGPVLPDAASGDLLAAFLRGLQRLEPAPQQLTPGLMERIGTLLRTAVEGTLQLLLARQQFKHELRAERTMIATQDNNPLKFSPTVDVALAHLLGSGMHGFMPAEAAMRDAFDDLRAHQFGMMVGMRAALTQLVDRLAPDEIEKKLAAKSALDDYLAVLRKARLWDQFVQIYAGIAAEAEENFDSVLGKTFVQAYEEQMARLKSAGCPGREAKK